MWKVLSLAVTVDLSGLMGRACKLADDFDAVPTGQNRWQILYSADYQECDTLEGRFGIASLLLLVTRAVIAR
jgi:hypothetical protein